MQQLLSICLGGAIGTGARYLVGLGAAAALGTGFPYGTLIVNTVGSFLIGVVLVLGVDFEVLPPPWRLFLATGVMGGFTTYSSFNYETLELVKGGAWTLAALNVLGTLAAAALAGLLGAYVGARLGGGG